MFIGIRQRIKYEEINLYVTIKDLVVNVDIHMVRKQELHLE